MKRLFCLLTALLILSCAVLPAMATSDGTDGESESSSSISELEEDSDGATDDTSSEEASVSSEEDAWWEEDTTSSEDEASSLSSSTSSNTSAEYGSVPPLMEDSYGQMPSDGVGNYQLETSYQLDTTIHLNPVPAKVSLILTDETLKKDLFPLMEEESVVFEAVVEKGEYQGTTVSSLQPLDSASAAVMRSVKQGDHIYLTLYRDDSGTLRGMFSTYHRVTLLWVMLGALSLLLIVICRRRSGFKLVISLGAGAILVSIVFLPLIQAGVSPFLAGALTGCMIAVAASFILYGIKYRTLAAALGSSLSALVCGLLAYSAQILMRLSGVAEMETLRSVFDPEKSYPLGSALTAGILLAFIGCSIALANTAAAGAEPKDGRLTSVKDVYIHGYYSGSAALPPLLTTLGLFSLGLLTVAAVPLYLSGMPFGRIFSDEGIANLIAAFFCCGLGLLFCLPLTSLLCVLFLKVRLQKDGTLREFHIKEALIQRQQALFGKAAENLDKAVRSAAGETEKAEQDLAEAQQELEQALEQEELELEATQAQLEAEIRQENAVSHHKPHRRRSGKKPKPSQGSSESASETKEAPDSQAPLTENKDAGESRPS